MVIIIFFFNILCQIHIFNNNVATFMSNLFYDENIMFVREKTQYQISLGKHAT